jgi:hypothetical protein
MPKVLLKGVPRHGRMLDLCLRAFEAVPVSKEARKLLKEMGETPAAYAGDGRHILAELMAKKLLNHISSADYGS